MEHLQQKNLACERGVIFEIVATDKRKDGESRDRDWIFDGSKPEEFAEWKEWSWAALQLPCVPDQLQPG